MQTAATASRRLIVFFLAALAVHAFFCLSLHYHYLDRFFYITTHAKGQGGCFFGVYQAGANLLDGESIYANETYRTLDQLAVPFYHYYRYVPFPSYVASVVTRVLKPWPAYWIWVVINEILLATCIVMTLRLRKQYGTAAIIASAFWLLFSPMYIELHMGQFCFTMAFFIFLMLYPYLKAKSHETGGDPALAAPSSRLLSPLSWILSVLLKSFTALYTITLLRIGKKKLVILGLALAILTSVPYFAQHPQDLKHFIRINFQPLPAHTLGGYFGFSVLIKDISNRVLAFAGDRMIGLGPLDISVTNIPVLVALACIFLLTLFLTVRTRRVDPLASISLWTLTFFLVFRDIWEYHYVMLLPILVAYYLQTSSKFILVIFILLAIPTPFFLYDVPGSDNPQAYWSAPLSLLHHSFKAVPTLLLYLWIVRKELAGIPGLRSLLSPGQTAQERA
jgi:hypothetical protein